MVHVNKKGKCGAYGDQNPWYTRYRSKSLHGYECIENNAVSRGCCGMLISRYITDRTISFLEVPVLHDCD